MIGDSWLICQSSLTNVQDSSVNIRRKGSKLFFDTVRLFGGSGFRTAFKCSLNEAGLSLSDIYKNKLNLAIKGIKAWVFWRPLLHCTQESFTNKKDTAGTETP
jgi:hypothetical protein